MKIQEIYLKNFGPYQDWSFKPGKAGVQFIYGANESGKTSLLEGIRCLLFGWKNKHYEACVGHLELERGNHIYHVGRDGKKLDFYPLGEDKIAVEPSELWWHGLDKKTYDRIFALTLEDLQGADILSEVEVRTRFFGAEGGERISEAVKDIEKTAAELLVASANGKRKINVLMESLRQNQAYRAELSKNEDIYNALQQKLDSTAVTEKELLERQTQWQDYLNSVDMVLRAWDTYKRAEEAKSNMSKLTDSVTLEKEAFLELDQEINQCQEYMRIWRGKEEGLIPDNFSPDSPLGLYSQDIEALYQQLGTWEQLKKECEQGESYLKQVREQLRLSRKMHTSWRDDIEMPTEVDWFVGEKLARELRAAKEVYQQWQLREPINTLAKDREPAIIAGDFSVSSKSPEPQIGEAELEKMSQGIEEITMTFQDKDRYETDLRRVEQTSPNMKHLSIISVVMVIIGAVVYAFNSNLNMILNIISVAFLLLAIGIYGYGVASKIRHSSEVEEFSKQIKAEEEKLVQIAETYQLPIPSNFEDLKELRQKYEALRKKFYNHDLELAQLHGFELQHAKWEAEGKGLEENCAKALQKWKEWLPTAANQALTDNDFFGMKQEYDQYMDQVHQFEGYEKRQAEHREKLNELEETAKDLWNHLELETEPSTSELRRLYGAMKSHQQNQVRWEQKESQRKNFREEYDQWNRKEKDLLLRQAEILQRSGISSATEYRQKLLAQDQYQQWDTIYKQSQVQLNLLAPRKESYDLLCRRLKEGNKAKWLEEHAHSVEELDGIQKKLANLYEQRGEISENMRALASSKDMAQALQEREALEFELSAALEDWTTQVLISHFIDTAQQDYEKEKQPQVLDFASRYISKMTDGKYKLDVALASQTDGTAEVCLLDSVGNRLPSKLWSSGLADQVYLALRLSLAGAFSKKVEALPIILDDILLRFDEDRQKKALELLAELGKETQVWVLSCQENLLIAAGAVSGIDCHRLS